MAPVSLTITLNDNGSVSINGPLTNKLLCWGMLTAAEKLVETYEKPLIEVPDFITPPDVKQTGKVTEFPRELIQEGN